MYASRYCRDTWGSWLIDNTFMWLCETTGFNTLLLTSAFLGWLCTRVCSLAAGIRKLWGSQSAVSFAPKVLVGGWGHGSAQARRALPHQTETKHFFMDLALCTGKTSLGATRFPCFGFLKVHYVVLGIHFNQKKIHRSWLTFLTE